MFEARKMTAVARKDRVEGTVRTGRPGVPEDRIRPRWWWVLDRLGGRPLGRPANRHRHEPPRPNRIWEDTGPGPVACGKRRVARGCRGAGVETRPGACSGEPEAGERWARGGCRGIQGRAAGGRQAASTRGGTGRPAEAG